MSPQLSKRKFNHYFFRLTFNPTNGWDCGLFAIAFATELVHGSDPSLCHFDTGTMRQHLLCCLEKGYTCPTFCAKRREEFLWEARWRSQLKNIFTVHVGKSMTKHAPWLPATIAINGFTRTVRILMSTNPTKRLSGSVLHVQIPWLAFPSRIVMFPHVHFNCDELMYILLWIIYLMLVINRWGQQHFWFI